MRTRPTLSWTPTGEPAPWTSSLDEVVRVVGQRRVVVLSGAGLSTESGIPDYRGESGSLRRHTPMTYQDFVASETGRQRYWARSHLGWRTIARAQPNAGHRAVAALRAAGYLSGVITQNVDGLHQAAGTADAIELHGSLDRVICLHCRVTSPRESLDQRLRAANSTFDAVATRINPDGDVELADDVVREFRLVDCVDCGSGPLKPDVVFFGENVPSERVARCYAAVEALGAEGALLVAGSSLTVMSGLRFVKRAAQGGTPIVIVNRGVTRGDALASYKLEVGCSEFLTELVGRVSCF